MSDNAAPDFDSVKAENATEGDILDSLNAAFDEPLPEIEAGSGDNAEAENEKDLTDVGDDGEIDIDALFASGGNDDDTGSFDAPEVPSSGDAAAAAPDTTAEAAPEPTPEPAPEPAPEPVPDPVLDDLSEEAPEPRLADLETAPAAPAEQAPAKKAKSMSGKATSRQLDLTLLKAERIGDQLMKLATALGPAVSDIMSVLDSGRIAGADGKDAAELDLEPLQTFISGALDDLAARLSGVVAELGEKLDSAGGPADSDESSARFDDIAERLGSFQEQLNTLQAGQQRVSDALASDDSAPDEKLDALAEKTSSIAGLLEDLKAGLAQESDSTGGEALEQIVEQLNALAERLDGVKDAVSEVSAQPDGLDDLKTQISTLSDDVRSNPGLNAVARVVEGGFKRIDARLEALERRPHPENVSETLAPHFRSILTILQDLVSRPAPADPAAVFGTQFDALSRRLNELPSAGSFEKIGSSLSAGLSSLDSGLRQLQDRPEAERGLAAKLEEIAGLLKSAETGRASAESAASGKMDNISDALAILVKRPEAKFPVEAVEARFAEVFEGLETLARGLAPKEGLNQLIKNVHDVSEKLSGLAEKPGPETGLADLNRQLEGLSAKLTALEERPVAQDPSKALSGEFAALGEQILSVSKAMPARDQFNTVNSGIEKVSELCEAMLARPSSGDTVKLLLPHIDRLVAMVEEISSKPDASVAVDAMRAEIAGLKSVLSENDRSEELLQPLSELRTHLDEQLTKLARQTANTGLALTARMDTLSDTARSGSGLEDVASRLDTLADAVRDMASRTDGLAGKAQTEEIAETISENLSAMRSLLEHENIAGAVEPGLESVRELVSGVKEQVTSLAAADENSSVEDTDEKLREELNAVREAVEGLSVSEDLSALSGRFDGLSEKLEGLGKLSLLDDIAGKLSGDDRIADLKEAIETLGAEVSGTKDGLASLEKLTALDEILQKLSGLDAISEKLSNNAETPDVSGAIETVLNEVGSANKKLLTLLDAEASRVSQDNVADALDEAVAPIREMIAQLSEETVGAAEEVVETVGADQLKPLPDQSSFERLLIGFRFLMRNLGSETERLKDFNDGLAASLEDEEPSGTAETSASEAAAPDMPSFSADEIPSARILTGFRVALRGLMDDAASFRETLDDLKDKAEGFGSAAAVSGEAGDNLPAQTFDAEAIPSQQVLTGFRVILKQLSEDAEGFRAALSGLKGEIAQGVSQTGGDDLSHLPSIDEGIEAAVAAAKTPAPVADPETAQAGGQFVVGMQTIMRGLNSEVEAFSDAVRKVSGLAELFENGELDAQGLRPREAGLPAISDIDDISAPAAARKNFDRSIESFVVGMGVAMRSLQDEIRSLSEFNTGLKEGTVELPYVTSAPVPGSLDLESVSDLLTRLEARLEEAGPDLNQYYAGQVAQKQLGQGVAKVDFLLRNLQSEVERLNNINRTYENRLESFGPAGVPAIDSRLDDQQAVGRMSKTAIAVEMLLRSMQSELQRFTDLNSNYANNLQAADTSTAHLKRGMDDLERDAEFKAGISRSATGMQIMMQTFQSEIDRLANLNATLSEKAGGLMEGMGEPTPQFIQALEDMRSIAKQVNDGAPGAAAAKDMKALRAAIDKINDVGSRFAETIAQEGDLRAMKSENSDLLMALRDDIREQAAEFLAVAAALSRELDTASDQESDAA